MKAWSTILIHIEEVSIHLYMSCKYSGLIQETVYIVLVIP